MEPKRKMVSLRLSGQGQRYMALLLAKTGLSQSDIVELGMRALAIIQSIPLEEGEPPVPIPANLQPLADELADWGKTYCTYEEAARMLDVSERALRYRVDQGYLKIYRYNNSSATPYLKRSEVLEQKEDIRKRGSGRRAVGAE